MYKRVLLKLSGEALRGHESSSILDVKYLKTIVSIIKEIYDSGIQVAVVIGAGNIWRGKLADEIGIERIPADYMGMLGTVINAVAVSSNLKTLGVESVVYSSIPAIDGVSVKYDKEEAKKSLLEGKVVFLSGGTGKPFFTTDTAATMLALDIDADALLMAKNGVDGVYSDDPSVNKNAILLKKITYREMLKMNLKVMDSSAVEMLLDKDIEVRVFNMADTKNFMRVINGLDIGTTCRKD